MVKTGDLIRVTSGRSSGKYATVVSDTYTHRKMEAQDYDMESHGLGHLAGVYCTAFNIVFTEGNGRTQRFICGDHTFERLDSKSTEVRNA
jgi:hypothetical protein